MNEAELVYPRSMPKPPPRIPGRMLRAVRMLAENPMGGVAVREIFRRGLRVTDLASLPHEWRAPLPMQARPVQAREPRPAPPGDHAPPADHVWPRTCASYHAAFKAKTTTPTDVAARALTEARALAGRRPSMNILTASDEEATMRDAAASTARYAAGAALGPLDGVPALIKDEFDVAGLPTMLGTRCEDPSPRARDSAVMARLRRAGAVFIGKTVLTEWGMSPIGCNLHVTMPRNAHSSTHAPGGSSTGSAVGVALGIAPIAAGGDGGGSIRTPASLNGVFGLKPTFGRVSRAGDAFAGSVAHAGPLGSSVACLVAFLDAVASELDPEDALTSWAPPPPAGGFGSRVRAGVRGLTIGVPEEEWSDAHPDVAKAGREALRALEREGATLARVTLPLAKYAAPIGYCTIGPESLAAHRRPWLERRDDLADDLRITFAVLSGLTALEQIDAQRLREGLRKQTAEVLRSVDVIAIPTTATTAPRCTEQEAREGFSDSGAMDGLCRFAFLGNLTGLPAGTTPVGADAEGLPIGLQILGDAWDEATVLGVMAHLERAEIARVRRPVGAVELY